MQRRAFLKQSAAVSIGAIAASCSPEMSKPGSASKLKPRNVLILMTDQQHPGALSCLGHPHIKTPNIDRLAEEGVLFENACCAAPVCTASRCGLHTGQYPHLKGPNLNCGAPETDPATGVQPDTPLLATYFHENGYRTCHHGKWHLGDIKRHSAWNWNSRAENYFIAYDKFLSKCEKKWEVTAPEGDAELFGWPLYMTDACKKAYHNAEELIKGHPAPTFMCIGRTSLPLEYDRTTFATDCLLDDFNKYGRDPFMMVWSVVPPHAEWLVQDPYYSMVDINKLELPTNMTRPKHYEQSFACKLFDLLGEEGVREYLRCYYAQVMQVDDQVGRIIDKLEHMGQLDDTLIVFTSDHGDMNGSHKAVGKGFQAYYDEIVKVPLIIRWPKGIKPGRKVKTIVNNVDVMPTLLDYAGLEIPSDCHGQSLRSFIDGKEDMQRAGYCERTHPELEIAERMIRTHQWKLSFSYWTKTGTEFRPPELYDLSADPTEQTNIASDSKYEPVKQKLLKRLTGWMEDTNDPWLKRLPKLV